MSKRIIALIVSFILGLIFTPTILSNADDFTPSVMAFDSPKTEEIVETTSKPEQTIATANARTVQTKTTVATNSTPAAPNASVVVPQMINYTVTRYVGTEQEYSNTAYSLSYSDIYRYGKMVYGHNSSNLLGNLSTLGVGTDFTITEGGVATKYRVASVQLYELKNGYLNGEKGLMRSVANTALGHTVVVFTCAGTPDGNGGASHRLAVFADAV